MRIAVVSDIHANIEALRAALRIIDDKRVDRIVCLGDVVGYGANPNECLALICQRTPFIVLGNHDEAAFDLSRLHHFNPHARVAAQWTHAHTTKENQDILRGLALAMDVEGALFVHGSPCRPGEWNYIITREDAQHNFGSFDQAVCFVGHSHVPEIFLQKPAQAKISKLDRTNRCIINVGSIGQPRDGDWRLSFGILDTEEWTYENVRAEYDVRSAYRKILEAGLPRILAERLLVGK